jgi:putative protease
MTGRDSNRGECAQPCRWKYKLRTNDGENVEKTEYLLYEEKRPDYPFSIGGDCNGTYIMNAKDLCMIEHLDKLHKAGITSFKIEGRMKTAYYVAVTTNAYRKALDHLIDNPDHYVVPKNSLEELDKVSHREYCTGFYFGNPYEDGQLVHTSDYVRDYLLVGVVIEKTGDRLIFEQRNKFYCDDELDILTTWGESIRIKATDLRNSDDQQIPSAPHAQQIVSIQCDKEIPKNSMIRLKKVGRLQS